MTTSARSTAPQPLAPRPRGQRPAHRARRLGAHHQQVEVPPHVEPLIGVVEDQHLGAPGPGPARPPPRRSGSATTWASRHQSFVDPGLIAAAVPAEQDAGNQALRGVVLRDPGRDRASCPIRPPSGCRRRPSAGAGRWTWQPTPAYTRRPQRIASRYRAPRAAGGPAAASLASSRRLVQSQRISRWLSRARAGHCARSHDFVHAGRTRSIAAARFTRPAATGMASRTPSAPARTASAHHEPIPGMQPPGPIRLGDAPG